MITRWRATSAEVKADVDARVRQAERAKLADKYEKCFRKILRKWRSELARVWERNEFQAFSEFAIDEIEKVYKKP